MERTVRPWPTPTAPALVFLCATALGASLAGRAEQPPAAPASTARADWDVRQARGTPRDIDFTTDEGTWMTVSVAPDGRTLVFDR
jgi:hypothetical protein